MSMGLAGLLTTVFGIALAATGHFYFDSSLWLFIPGSLLVLVGLSLLSGAKEQALTPFRHSIYDGHAESKTDERCPKEH